jgi:hypothetical protein
MNGVTRLLMGLTMLSLAGLMAACASVQPSDTVRVEVREREAVVAAGPGTTVHLFYGKSKKAKEEFCVGAIVPVYRLEGDYGTTYANKVEVGKLKVTKDLGEHYIEAVVLEGSLRAGDIATLDNSECLVQPGKSLKTAPGAAPKEAK